MVRRHASCSPIFICICVIVFEKGIYCGRCCATSGGRQHQIHKRNKRLGVAMRALRLKWTTLGPVLQKRWRLEQHGRKQQVLVEQLLRTRSAYYMSCWTRANQCTTRTRSAGYVIGVQVTNLTYLDVNSRQCERVVWIKSNKGLRSKDTGIGRRRPLRVSRDGFDGEYHHYTRRDAQTRLH